MGGYIWSCIGGWLFICFMRSSEVASQERNLRAYYRGHTSVKTEVHGFWEFSDGPIESFWDINFVYTSLLLAIVGGFIAYYIEKRFYNDK